MRQAEDAESDASLNHDEDEWEWVDTEVLRLFNVAAMDGVPSVEEMMARRALPAGSD